MKKLALTGGIASGKTTVAKFFEELGAVVLDADREAHEIYAPGTPLFHQLQERFGSDLVVGGQIDRKRLAQIVFTSPKEKKWLEEQTHPATRQRITQKLSQAIAQDPPLILVEAALHVETGYYRDFDGLVVVYVPEAIALGRLQARDGIGLEEAKLRLKNQISIEEKRQRADWVIDNSGSLEETRRQVEDLFVVVSSG